MINKLKNLDYVSIKEIENLDEIELLFIDFEKLENEQNAIGFTKPIGCGSVKISNLEDITQFIEDLFIQKINSILRNEQIINVDKKLIQNENVNIIKETINKFLIPLKNKRKNIDGSSYCSFIFVPKGFNIHSIYNGIDYIFETEKLDNEIIFGCKTEIDEPGIILITNEEGLQDKDNIRFALTDIGFYPEKSYYKIKLEN